MGGPARWTSVVAALVLAGCSGAASPDAATPAARPATSSGTATTSGTATSSTSADPAPTAGAPTYAFQDSNFRILLVGPDGVTQPLDSLTSGPEDNPDWSPDGSRLTFVGQGTDLGSHPGLWVVGADGTGLRRLVDCTGSCRFVDDPAWSPDGDEIAFTRLAPGRKAGGTLEVVDVLSGRTRTLLTAKPGEGYAGVRYAPDGKAMVLEWVHATAQDYDDTKGVTLIAVDLTTSPPRTKALTDPALFAQTADWSPKGDLIQYAALPAAGARGTDLYLVRPDGTGRRRLTTLADRGGAAEHADFSNDARTLVFVGADPQHGLDGLLQVDVAAGTVSAFGKGNLTGHHPRSRPVP